MSFRLPEAEYKALCKKVLQRDGWRCRSCNSRVALHCHHVIFRSQDGDDTLENVLTLCLSCHEGVHRDVKNGVYGLVINFDHRGIPVMVRRPGWKPQ
jgi:5-methylcytosine-specific restriction endonuclease McrA